MSPRTRLRNLTAACLTLWPVVAGAHDDPKPTPKTAAEITQALQDYMEATAENDGFSGVALIARDGQPLLRDGYGMADLEHQSPNTANSKFRIGSITKPLTAVLTLILSEQGKLGLDDSVSKLWPEAPGTWSPVTIRHLLNHTSGIPSFTSLPSYGPDKNRKLSHEQMIARFRDLPLEFEPGSKFNYSNSGYYLLGFLLEKAGDKPYEDLLREHVLDPLKMTDTGYDHAEEVLANRADGYERLGDKVVHADHLDMGQPFAAGAIYSTVDDLLKFDRALVEKKLLSPDSYATMYRPVHNNYACGWIVQDQDGHPSIWHNGGIDGFQSSLLRFPDEGLCAVVLSNLIPAKVDRIAGDLAKIARGEEVTRPEARKQAKVDPKILDRYVGRYRLGPDLEIVVTREGEALFGEAVGESKVMLRPESDTVFFAHEIEGTFTFVVGEDGKATHFLIDQGGGEQKAERVDE